MQGHPYRHVDARPPSHACRQSSNDPIAVLDIRVRPNRYMEAECAARLFSLASAVDDFDNQRACAICASNCLRWLAVETIANLLECPTFTSHCKIDQLVSQNRQLLASARSF